MQHHRSEGGSAAQAPGRAPRRACYGLALTSLMLLVCLLSLHGDFAMSYTPLINHLVMREFVSGPPSYRSIHKRIRDRKPSLKESS